MPISGSGGRADTRLAFQEYSKAIDVWSVGCILAEMSESERPPSAVLTAAVNGKPLFPGRDYHHQLSLILECLGTPTMDDFNEITSPRSKYVIASALFFFFR